MTSVEGDISVPLCVYFKMICGTTDTHPRFKAHIHIGCLSSVCCRQDTFRASDGGQTKCLFLIGVTLICPSMINEPWMSHKGVNSSLLLASRNSIYILKTHFETMNETFC